MRYPNAKKGIRKLFAAEILQLISIIITTTGSVFFALFSATIESEENMTISMLAIGLVLLTLVSGVLAVVAMLINLIGVIQTAKDEPAFKVIIYVMIVGIVATVTISIADIFVTDGNAALTNFLQVISDMVNSITTILIIQGISNIAQTLDDALVIKKGNTLFHLIICIALISIAMRAIILCIPEKVAVPAEVVLMITSTVLSIVQYFIYLSFLRRASKMLADA